jgi:hypothetical protein
MVVMRCSEMCACVNAVTYNQCGFPSVYGWVGILQVSAEWWWTLLGEERCLGTDRLAHATIGPLRSWLGMLTSAQSLKNRDDRFGREVLIKVIVDLNHWSIDTGSQAFNLEYCEQLIGSCFWCISIAMQ